MAPATPMELRTRPVGPWPMNTYALICPHTASSVLIDPGAEPETLREMLAGSAPVAILITHTHRDHVGELDLMKETLGVPVMAFPGERSRGIVPAADRWLAHGDVIQVGAHALRVAHTPGHSEDMLCFAIGGDHRVVVGDTIFAGGPGRTWSAEAFQTTLRTLREQILRWPDATVCYPGHGPAFRLGDIRPAIEAFCARDHGEFFGDATW